MRIIRIPATEESAKALSAAADERDKQLALAQQRGEQVERLGHIVVCRIADEGDLFVPGIHDDDQATVLASVPYRWVQLQNMTALKTLHLDLERGRRRLVQQVGLLILADDPDGSLDELDRLYDRAGELRRADGPHGDPPPESAATRRERLRAELAIRVPAGLFPIATVTEE